MNEVRRTSEAGHTHKAVGERNGCGGMLNGCGSFQGCGHPNRVRSLPGATPAQHAWAAAKVVLG
jgi:hypothetical protein